ADDLPELQDPRLHRESRGIGRLGTGQGLRRVVGAIGIGVRLLLSAVFPSLAGARTGRWTARLYSPERRPIHRGGCGRARMIEDAMGADAPPGRDPFSP